VSLDVSLSSSNAAHGSASSRESLSTSSSRESKYGSSSGSQVASHITRIIIRLMHALAPQPSRCRRMRACGFKPDPNFGDSDARAHAQEKPSCAALHVHLWAVRSQVDVALDWATRLELHLYTGASLRRKFPQTDNTCSCLRCGSAAHAAKEATPASPTWLCPTPSRCSCVR